MNGTADRTPDADLLDDFRAGRTRALARAISRVENARPGFEDLLHALHDRVGRAHRIGVTGPPGAGKSTLIRALAGVLRERDERVGVVAVDPTSPFTGGALLGDRIRMTEMGSDEGVFIRSMASRGSVGGLATTSREVADLMDAFGFDRVIVETVGVGQSELEIAGAADTTVVILTPESGDAIQAMKAGLMEIAEIFVLNKGDRPDADRAVHELETMLRLRQGQTYDRVPAHHGADLTAMARKLADASPGEAEAADTPADGSEPWAIPVLKTVAQTGDGIPTLLDTIDEHWTWLQETGELERRRGRRLLERVRAVVERRMRVRIWTEGRGTAVLEHAVPDLESGRRTPYDVAEEILGALGSGRRPDSG